VRGLVGLDLVGCDVVEVYPAYDPAQITALLAANVAYELLSLIAARRKEGLAHGAGRESSVRP
jgi:agmatinase